jgi:heptosyltransferase II
MRRILIIAPNWIGDAVMSQPLIAAIKSQFPESQIDVLAGTWVAPIYRACREVSDVIEAPLEHRKLQWGLRKTLAKTIKGNQYQACLILPNSFKSALIPWLAEIPLRIGYQGELRFGLLNRTLPNPSKVKRPPMTGHYLALSQLLYAKQKDSDSASKNPSLYILDFAKQAIEIKLSKAAINVDKLFVFCPGAEYGLTKRWPAEHFASLSRLLLDADPKNQIILLGGKGDYALGEHIQSQVEDVSRIQNWCGDTSLDEAIALIGLCHGMVSNDSGLMHIGAALKKPQIAIFGSSDPHHTPPLSDKAQILWLNLPCSPCHKRECPLGTLQCLQDISPQIVFDSITLLHQSS